MKHLIVLLFCQVPFLAYSQKGTLNIGPTGSYESANYVYLKDPFNANASITSEPRVSYGASLQCQLSKKLFLTSGALFTSQAFKKEFNWIFLDEGDPAIPRSTRLDADYLRVPLLLGLGMGSGKFIFLPSLGFSFDFLLGSSESTQYENGNEASTATYHPVLASPHTFLTVDLAMNFKPAERITFVIAPYLNQGLNVLDKQHVKSPETCFGGWFAVYYKVR